MWMSVCLLVYHMCAWCHGGQKRALEILELELQPMIMSHSVGTGN